MRQTEPPNAAALVTRLTPIVHFRVARTLRSLYPHEPAARLRQEIEDLVQDILIHLVVEGGLNDWNADRGLGFESFVDMVARRRVLDRHRPAKNRLATHRDPDLETPADEPGPLRRLLATDRLHRILRDLRHDLSDELWSTFELFFLRGLSSSETAVHQGISRQTLYARLSRLRKSLRRSTPML